MAKVTEIVIAYVELGASQEDIQNYDYAENRINSMSQYEFLELLGEAVDWADAMSEEELEKEGGINGTRIPFAKRYASGLALHGETLA